MKKLILITTILLALALPIKVEAKTNFVNSNNVLEVQVKFDDSGMYNDDSELLYLDCGNAKKIPAILPNISSVIFKMLQIILPLVLIVMGSVDLLKGVIGKKDDEIEKGKQTFIKRIILGGTFFFVVTLVRFIATLTVDTGEENTIGACIDCFINGSCDAAYSKAFVNDSETTTGGKVTTGEVDRTKITSEVEEKVRTMVVTYINTVFNSTNSSLIYLKPTERDSSTLTELSGLGSVTKSSAGTCGNLTFERKTCLTYNGKEYYGTDCNGFVAMMYKGAWGIGLSGPRFFSPNESTKKWDILGGTSATYFEFVSSSTSLEALVKKAKKADAIGRVCTDGNTHIGIYIGNNTIVENAGWTTETTRLNPLKKTSVSDFASKHTGCTYSLISPKNYESITN